MGLKESSVIVGQARLRNITTVVLAIACFGLPSAAAGTPPTAQLPRLTGAMELDGKASEPFWAKALPLSKFTVFEPKSNLNARFRVEAKAFITGDALVFYVRVGVGEDNLDTAVQTRDKRREDHVEIQLDPDGNGRRAFSFVVSPSGVLRDATVAPGGNDDTAWDSLFDAQTHVAKDHWSAEISIPASSLQFDPSKEHWKAHIFVRSWHFRQGLSWAQIDRDNTNRLAQMGLLKGTLGMQPGHNVELLPSLTLGGEKAGGVDHKCSYNTTFGAFDICGTQLEYGLRVKLSLTPSLALDTVFNPDYSQIEADAPQLEINNRFALHLVERRPFFLEGRDMMGDSLFYTRSIAQPALAVRLLGTVGRVRLMLLTALGAEPPDYINDPAFALDTETRLEEPDPEKYADADNVVTSVLRAETDLGNRATLGVVSVNKTFSNGFESEGYTSVLGADGAVHLTDSFRSETFYRFSAAKTLTNESLRDHNAKLRLVFQEDTYRIQSHYQFVGENYRNEAAYFPRVGYHNVFNKLDFYYRSENDWGRLISPGIWFNAFLDEEGELAERKVGTNNFWTFGPHLWAFWLYERQAELIEDNWLDGNHVTVATGGGPIEQLDFKLKLYFGDQIIRDSELLDGKDPYVGWQYTPSVNLTVRPIPPLSISADYNHRLLYESHSGRQLSSEPILRGVIDYFFTRALSLRYVLEWTGGNDLLVNDALFRYQPSPGTVLFLRYREQTNVAQSATLDVRSVFLKMSILYPL